MTQIRAVAFAVRGRQDASSLAEIGKSTGMAVAPIRSTVSPLSPQRKTAPRARPARRKDDVFRQVSWLAGLNPSPPSQALTAQWQTEEGLSADSCGGSSGFDSPPNGQSHRIPFSADQRDRRT
jgi:hypothetical protein